MSTIENKRKREREYDENDVPLSKRFKPSFLPVSFAQADSALFHAENSNKALHLEYCHPDPNFVLQIKNREGETKLHDIRFLAHLLQFEEIHQIQQLFGMDTYAIINQISMMWTVKSPYRHLNISSTGVCAPVSELKSNAFEVHLPIEQFNGMTQTFQPYEIVHFYTHWKGKYIHYFWKKYMENNVSKYVSLSSNENKIKSEVDSKIPVDKMVKQVVNQNALFALVQDYHPLNPKTCVCRLKSSLDGSIKISSSAIDHMSTIMDVKTPLQPVGSENKNHYVQISAVQIPQLFYAVLSVPFSIFENLKNSNFKAKFISTVNQGVQKAGVINEGQILNFYDMGMVRFDSVYGFVISPDHFSVQRDQISIEPCNAVSVDNVFLEEGFNLYIQPLGDEELKPGQTSKILNQSPFFDQICKQLVSASPHPVIESLKNQHRMARGWKEFVKIGNEWVNLHAKIPTPAPAQTKITTPAPANSIAAQVEAVEALQAPINVSNVIQQLVKPEDVQALSYGPSAADVPALMTQVTEGVVGLLTSPTASHSLSDLDQQTAPLEGQQTENIQVDKLTPEEKVAMVFVFLEQKYGITKDWIENFAKAIGNHVSVVLQILAQDFIPNIDNTSYIEKLDPIQAQMFKSFQDAYKKK